MRPPHFGEVSGCPEQPVHEEDHQGRDGLEEQEQVGVGGGRSEGGEPVGQAAHEGGRPPGNKAPGHEVEAHGRGEDGQVDEDVEGCDGAEEQRDREPEDPEERHGGVVHQVDPRRIVQPVVDQRIVAVQENPRCLGEEPDLFGDVVAPRRLDAVGDPVCPGAPVGERREHQVDDGDARRHEPCRAAGAGPGSSCRCCVSVVSVWAVPSVRRSVWRELEPVSDSEEPGVGTPAGAPLARRLIRACCGAAWRGPRFRGSAPPSSVATPQGRSRRPRSPLRPPYWWPGDDHGGTRLHRWAR